jgi:hypothetical protein
LLASIDDIISHLCDSKNIKEDIDKHQKILKAYRRTYPFNNQCEYYLEKLKLYIPKKKEKEGGNKILLFYHCY